MERDTGTGKNAQGSPAGYNMGINIIPPNINKKKGPTGINALYREITRQYMEVFYRALSNKSFFSPMEGYDYEDSQYYDEPPADDSVLADIYSMDPQNDAGNEETPFEYYVEMADDDYQQSVYDTQMGYALAPEPPDLDFGAGIPDINAGSDKSNIDVDIYDKSDIFSYVHYAIDDFYHKTGHTKLHAVKEYAYDIATGILDNIEAYIETNPAFKNITRRYAKPNKLTPDCIAQILLSADIFGRFRLENNTYLLGMYREEGPDAGVYQLLESEDDCLDLYKLMFEFDPGLKKPEREEIKKKLLIDAPLKKENRNPKLIALNNGIWFCGKDVNEEDMDKFFLPYTSSESREFVFTKKIRTDFNSNAFNKTINTSDGRGWDVESWMEEFFAPAEADGKPDEKKIQEGRELTHLLWCIIHAFCRPNVDYKRSIWFGNPGGKGNNGKGTFTALLRNLLGRDVCKSLNLKGFSENFALQGITHWIAIIADENAFKGNVDDVSRYKCIVTGDPVSVNTKFGKPFDYIFHGMTLQCFNEYPNVCDNTRSFARRLLLLNWEKHFDKKTEIRNIKDDYIGRKEVLEYVLKEVLLMGDIDELPEPKPVKDAISRYIDDTVPYSHFIKEFCLPDSDGRIKLRWKRMPIQFLYDLYSEWHKNQYQVKATETGPTFKNLLCNDSDLQGYWDVSRSRSYWSKKDLLALHAKAASGKDGTESQDGEQNPYISEPLINDYNLTKWKNRDKPGKQKDDWVCVPEHMIEERFYGFIKMKDDEYERQTTLRTLNDK